MLNVKVDEDGAKGFLVGKCQLPPLIHTLPELARAIIVDVSILRKTQDGISINLMALRGRAENSPRGGSPKSPRASLGV